MDEKRTAQGMDKPMKNNDNVRKQRIVLVTDLMAGRGGMENVTGQLITALNAEPGTEAGLFIINSGEEATPAPGPPMLFWLRASARCGIRK